MHNLPTIMPPIWYNKTKPPIWKDIPWLLSMGVLLVVGYLFFA